VGYVVDGREYLQVSQSNSADSQYLAEQTSGGQPEQEVTIQGQAWTLWTSVDRSSLVRQVDGVTTIVGGTVPIERLRSIAASLGSA
jgi:hypothetical protein